MSALNRTLAGFLLGVATLACESDASRAEHFEKQARALREGGDARGAVEYYDWAIQAKPTADVFVERAQALAEAGDPNKAIESLAGCHDDACTKERKNQARAAVAAAQGKPITDANGLRRYLDLQSLAGTEKTCALILATTKASPEEQRPRDPALLQALLAAMQKEIDRVKSTLPRQDVNDPDLTNALSFGSALGKETDCAALHSTAERLLEVSQVAAGLDRAYDRDAHYGAFVIGVLTAKRDALAGGEPTPVASRDWRNGGPCSHVIRLGLGQSCKTSKGVLVSREKRGQIGGTKLKAQFWSDHLPDLYAFRDAPAACKKLGMRLPSKQDFEAMRAAFEVEMQRGGAGDGLRFTDKGEAEFHRVFLDATEFVWSSTKGSAKTGEDWGFVSADGFIETGGYEQRVVCIAH